MERIMKKTVPEGASGSKVLELEQEVEKLKKEKQQKLVQFGQMDTLLKKTQQECKDFKKKYEDSTQEIRTLTGRLEELKQVHTHKKDEVAEASGSMDNLEQVLRQRTAELRQSEAQLAELQKQLMEQTEQVTKGWKFSNDRKLRQASSSSETVHLQQIMEKLQEEHKQEMEQIKTSLAQKERALSELNEQITQKDKLVEQNAAKLKTLAIKYTKEKEMWASNAPSGQWEEERNRLQNEIKSYQERMQSLQQNVDELALSNDALKLHMERKDKEQASRIQMVEMDIESLSQQLSHSKTAISELTQQLSAQRIEYEAKLSALIASEDKLRLCNTELEEKATNLQELLARVTDKSSQLAEQIGVLEAFRKEHLSILEAKERELEALRSKYTTLEENSDVLESKLNDLVAINAKKDTELQNVREDLEVKLHSYHDLEEKLCAAKEELESYRQSHSVSLADKTQQLEELRDQVASLTASLTEAAASNHELNKKVEITQIEIDRQRELLEREITRITSDLESEQHAHDQSKTTLLAKIREYEASIASLEETVAKYTEDKSQFAHQLETEFEDLRAKYDLSVADKEKLATCMTEKEEYFNEQLAKLSEAKASLKDELDAELTAHNETIEMYEAQVNAVHKYKESVADLQAQLTKSQNKIEEITNDSAVVRDSYQERVAALESSLSSLKETLEASNTLSAQHTDTRAQLASLEREYAEYQKKTEDERAGTSRTIEDLQQQLDSESNRCIEFGQSLTQSRRALDDMTAAFADEKRLLTEKLQQLTHSYETQLEALRIEREQDASLRSNLENQLKSNEQRFSGELAALNEVLDDLKAQLTTEQKVHGESKQLLEQRAVAIEGYEAAAQSLQTKIMDLTESVAKLSQEKEVYEAKIAELGSTLSTAQSRSATDEEQHQTLQRRNEELSRELSQLQEQLEESKSFIAATKTEDAAHFTELNSRLEAVRQECAKITSLYNAAKEDLASRAQGEQESKVAFERRVESLQQKLHDQVVITTTLTEQVKQLKGERDYYADYTEEMRVKHLAVEEEFRNQIDDLTVKYTQSKAEVEQLRDTLQRKEQSVKESEEITAKVHQDLEAERHAHDVTKGQLEAQRDSTHSLEDTITRLVSQIQDSEASVSRFEQDKDQIAREYDQKLAALDNTIASVRAELEASKSSNEDYRSQVVDLTQTLTSVETEYCNFKTESLVAVAQREQHIVELKNRLASLEEENAQVIVARDATKQAMERAQDEYLKETTALREELRNLKQVQSDNAQNSVTEEQLQQVNAALRTGSEKLASLQQELVELKQLLNNKTDEIAFLQEESTVLSEELASTKESLSKSEQMNQDLHAQVAELEHDRAALEEKCMLLSRQTDEGNDKLHSIAQELEAKRMAVQELSGLFDVKKQEYQQTTEALERSKKELVDALEKEHDQVAVIEEQLRVATAKLRAAETSLSEIRGQDKVELGAIQSDRDTLFEQLESEIQEHMNTKQDIERKQAHIEEQNEKIRLAESECTNLKQVVSAKEEELLSQQRRIAELEEELVAVRHERDNQLNSASTEFDTFKETKIALQDEIEKLRLSESTLKAEKDRTLSELEYAQQQSATLQQEVETLRNQVDVMKDRLQADNSSETSSRALQEALEQRDLFEASLEEKNDELVSVSQKLDTLQQQLKQTCDELANATRAAATSKQDAETIQIALDEARSLNNKLSEELADAVQALEESKSSYEQKIRDDAFSIETLKTQAEHFREQMSEVKEKAKEAQANAKQQIDELIETFQKETKDLEQKAESEVSSLQDQLAASKKTIEELEQSLTEVTLELTTVRQATDKSSTDLEERVTVLMEELDKERKQREEIKEERERIAAELIQTGQTIVQQTEQNKDLASKIELLKAQHESAEQKVKDLQEVVIERDTLRGQMSHLENRAAEADKLETDLKSADSGTQALREQLAALQEMLKQRDATIESMESDNKRLLAKEEEAEQMTIKYNSVIQENRKLGKKISSLEAKMTSISKKLHNSAEPKSANSLPTPTLSSLPSTSGSAQLKSAASLTSAKGPSLQPKLTTLGSLSNIVAVQIKRPNSEASNTEKPTSPHKKMRAADNATIPTHSSKSNSTELTTTPARAALQEVTGSSSNVAPSTTPGKTVKPVQQPKRAILKEDLEKNKESEENCNVQ